MMKQVIYLDNNATTEPLPIVRDRMTDFLAEFGNPSSQHAGGSRARQRVEEARSSVAAMIRALPESIFFTSGGTESISWAIAQEWDMLIVSTVEHAAVLDAAKARESRGAIVNYVGVDKSGELNEDELIGHLRRFRARNPRGKVFVSLMMANNETGVIFPIEKLAPKVKEYGALLHVDAIQCIGKVPVDVNALQCDYLSLSAHKFHGLKGAGALFRTGQVPLIPLIHGHHERGRRGGTENVPGILAMGLAANEVAADLECLSSTAISELRDLLEAGLSEGYRGARVNGGESPRIPNTSNVLFPKRDGAMLVEALSRQGIMASTGAACSTGGGPSHVLRAMGLSAQDANASLRFSLSNNTTKEEIQCAVQIISDIANGMMDAHRVNG